MIVKNKVIVGALLLIGFLLFVLFNFSQNNDINEVEKDTPIFIDNEIETDLDFPIDENNETKKTEEIILFYGIGCPACTVLDQLLEDRGINDEILYDHKEVYYNQGNSSQLIAKAEDCGLDTNSISIPFLWADGNCYIGIEPIINYFEEKIYD